MFGASAEVLELLAERERSDARLVQAVGAWTASGEWSADAGRPRVGWCTAAG
jgi:hypothetical protein